MHTEIYSGGSYLDRMLMYTMPSDYDSWGFDEQGNQWLHSFCVIDDFGNAVPVAPWNHYEDGYRPYMAPDVNLNMANTERAQYVLIFPTIH